MGALRKQISPAVTGRLHPIFSREVSTALPRSATEPFPRSQQWDDFTRTIPNGEGSVEYKPKTDNELWAERSWTESQPPADAYSGQ